MRIQIAKTKRAGRRPYLPPSVSEPRTTRETVSFLGRTVGAAAAAAYGAGGGIRAGVPLLANLAWGAVEPTLNPPLLTRASKNERKASLLRCALPAVASAAASLTLGPLGAAGVAVGACCLDEFLVKPLLQESPEDFPHMAVAREVMGIEQIWKKGFSGQGSTVAVLDTGGSPHPDLEGRILAFQDTVERRSGKLYDGYTHGTMVNSLVAGDGSRSAGQFAGAAPQANLVSVRGLKGKRSGIKSVIAGMEWILENRDEHDIKVVNLSLGLKDIDPEKDVKTRKLYTKLLKLVDRAVDAGIIPVVAAGNDGKEDHLHLLSLSRNVIAVANYDTRGTETVADDRIAPSSARPKRFKGPDVAAMGCDVVYANGRGGYTHERGGGTSSAAAWVSGIMAAWVEAVPDLTVKEALEAIRATSKPLPRVGARVQGAGLIQADLGLEWLLARRSEENSGNGVNVGSTRRATQ